MGKDNYYSPNRRIRMKYMIFFKLAWKYQDTTTAINYSCYRYRSSRRWCREWSFGYRFHVFHSFFGYVLRNRLILVLSLNNCIIDLMFFSTVAFLFNWIGFLLLMCFCHTIASRYGALSGFGLSLTKWTLIVKHSTDLASRENSWLWWLIMAFGL